MHRAEQFCVLPPRPRHVASACPPCHLACRAFPHPARRYVFHYIVEDGITYLCLADEQQKRRLPFQFLADIKDKFKSMYGDRAKTAITLAMNAEFARLLAERMVRGRPPAPSHPVRRSSQQ